MSELLKNTPLFAGLPEEDLTRLLEASQRLKLVNGELLFAEGSEGDTAYVIESGELEIFRESQGREVLLTVRGPGTMIGEMALIDFSGIRTAGARARGVTNLVVIGKEQFEELLSSSPAALRAMYQLVLARLKENESRMLENTKMAQLGTLTAGVAHELNNPAAAIKRSAEQLNEAIRQLVEAQSQLAGFELTEVQSRSLHLLAHKTEGQALEAPRLDAMQRADLQDSMERWLETRQVADAWQYAGVLVDIFASMEELEQAVGQFSNEQTPTVLEYLVAIYNTNSLTNEINTASGRVANIVKALKSYSYLDQAPMQDVDIQKGLEDTLLILRSKLKDGVEVLREYGEDMPHIEAYGSELNQVWTNLIDNAADAMNGKGALTLRTRLDGKWYVVEVEDNGPGIPDNVLPKLFNPFFTTKEPGQGTGLGLDISYNIVVNKHRGDVKVLSEPGKTVFQVWLPLKLEK
ncbi:MAG: histidine kinase [Chloroflexi bacterium]|nr:MAG: histidine kinase [Chloroflexota bacterium]